MQSRFSQEMETLQSTPGLAKTCLRSVDENKAAKSAAATSAQRFTSLLAEISKGAVAVRRKVKSNAALEVAAETLEGLHAQVKSVQGLLLAFGSTRPDVALLESNVDSCLGNGFTLPAAIIIKQCTQSVCEAAKSGARLNRGRCLQICSADC